MATARIAATEMQFVRIVADTNVLVSGSLWNGAPARILAGDGDLLHLGTFCGIPILGVEAMLARISR
jgi:hypothetical protein